MNDGFSGVSAPPNGVGPSAAQSHAIDYPAPCPAKRRRHFCRYPGINRHRAGLAGMLLALLLHAVQHLAYGCSLHYQPGAF
jgi:hypothetical protein